MSAASVQARSTVTNSSTVLFVDTYSRRVAIAANARTGTSSGRITRIGPRWSPVGFASSMPFAPSVPSDGSVPLVQADQLGGREEVCAHRRLDLGCRFPLLQ